MLQHLKVTLRLYARNKMALFYSYLFPIIFFAAFLVLYRYEQPKLVQHMGELLTVSILGGACFGLPTSMVSDRERGVWRRYRLTPVPAGNLVASTLVARYVTVLTAGLVQLVLAMLVGRWFPEHPLDLWLAFTVVTFAFLGLGLVIAMLADNVPAVQALGQCIFLPMLIIGGVAVKLTSLPEWALHVSAFFPGRYAVETMQECVKGAGLGPMAFNLGALVLIGSAGCLAGAKLFRWDAQQHFISQANKAWLGVALAAWALVGISTEIRRETAPRSLRQKSSFPAESIPLQSTQIAVATISVNSSALPQAVMTTMHASNPPALPLQSNIAAISLTNTSTSNIAATNSSESIPTGIINTITNTNNLPLAVTNSPIILSTSVTSAVVTVTPIDTKTNKVAEPWRNYTTNDFAGLDYDNLPSDSGSVAPIAAETDQLDPSFEDWLDTIERELKTWPPGMVKDPVQRTRNLLFLIGAIDEARHPLERFVPAVVLARLKEDFKDAELAQILCWIAKHPTEGDDSAIGDFEQFKIQLSRPDVMEVRLRTYFYALKFLQRLTK